MSRSCTYAVGDTTKNERFRVHGIFEREKQFDDISKMGEYEIQISESRILV